MAGCYSALAVGLVSKTGRLAAATGGRPCSLLGRSLWELSWGHPAPRMSCRDLRRKRLVRRPFESLGACPNALSAVQCSLHNMLRAWHHSTYGEHLCRARRSGSGMCPKCRKCRLIPGSGRSLGGGRGNALHYSCPETPTGRGAWRAAVQT